MVATPHSSVIAVAAISENVSKRIESHLRNAGHAIRCAWMTDLEDIEDALGTDALELLICADTLNGAPVTSVIDLSKRAMPDLSVLVLTETITPESAAHMLSLGAADIVSDADAHSLLRLEQVVLREINTHQRLRELRQLRTRLAEFESRHQQLVSQTNDAVAHIQEGIITYANPAFAQLLGSAHPEELTNLPLMDVIAHDDHAQVKARIKRLLRGKPDDQPLACALTQNDRAPIPIVAHMTLSQSDGEPMIEMLIRAEATAPSIAAAPQPAPMPMPTPDTAPVVRDRGAYFDALESRLGQAANATAHGAVLLVVIDDFVGAEQRLGLRGATLAADACAQWLSARLLPDDQLFRFSAHEFACLIARDNAVDLVDLGESLVKAATEHVFNTATHEAHLSLSVGLYPYTQQQNAHTLTAELVEQTRAHSAQGGRHFAHYGPNAEASLQEREMLRKADMVRQALADNRLKLAYQSIASLEGDPRPHYDVLLRLIDAAGVEHQATEFIGAAEQYDLMRDIDRWVTTRVIKVQSKRDQADDTTTLCIKLSQATIKDAEAFVPWLQQLVADRPLKPGEVVFQIQERVAQDHIRKIRMLAKALIDIGAQMAMEHFGIGTNSTQMLDHIPMQFIKFHPSFSTQFGQLDTRKKMAELMTRAKQKNIKVIVSHVEDANTMAQLWQMGVNFIQGFHIQEPEMVMLSADLRA